MIVRMCILARLPPAGQAACLHTVRKNTGTVRFSVVHTSHAWLSAAYGGHNPAITRPSIELCSAPCNASALRADRYAASGIDSASAQLSVGTYVMARVVRQVADG